MKLNYRQLLSISNKILKESLKETILGNDGNEMEPEKEGYGIYDDFIDSVIDEAIDERFIGNPDCWEMSPDEEDPNFPYQDGDWTNDDAACFGYFKMPDDTYRMVVSPLSQRMRVHFNTAVIRFSNEILQNPNEKEIAFFKRAIDKIYDYGYEYLSDNNVGDNELNNGLLLQQLVVMIRWFCGMDVDETIKIYPELVNNNKDKFDGFDKIAIKNFMPDYGLYELAQRIINAYKDDRSVASRMSYREIRNFLRDLTQKNETEWGKVLLNARYGLRYDTSLNRNEAKMPGRLWYDKKFIAFWGRTPSPEEMKTVLKDITNDEGYEGPPYEELIQTYILGAKLHKGVFLRDYMSSSMKNVEVGKDNGMDIRIPHEANPMEKERLRKKLGVKRVQGNYGSEFIPKDMRPGELMAQYHARKYQESRSLIGKILREEIIKII